MRKALAISAITSMGTILAIVSPNLVSADQINTSENILQGEVKNDTDILDWKVPIFNATKIVGENLDVSGKYMWTMSTGYMTGYENAKYEQFSVEADGSPTITNSTNIFVGKSTLTNDTDQEQTLSTNSFSKMISNSIAHSTTHGFKFGTKASATYKIPFVGETSIELSAEYNFSDTSSQTNTESYTYTANPQNIKVPAHSSVDVIVNLDTVKAKGDVKLLAKISGEDFGMFIYDMTPYPYNLTFNQIAERASKYEKLQDISANPDGKTVNLIGSGKYEAEYGTNFSVTVRPVDKNGKSVNEGYTYKVNPEITKAK
ncbi:sulfurtransferase [Bacillus thuringiensis]|nr:sulfurtransferase [Bacillus thuringiensis]HDR5267526.1 ETX/MTX2 family pore-forming toxin [Bacillus thuringiensis]